MQYTNLQVPILHLNCYVHVDIVCYVVPVLCSSECVVVTLNIDCSHVAS